MKRKLNDAIASSSSLGSISEGYKSDDEKSDDVGGESEVVNVEEDHMDEKENNNNDINYASSHNIAPSDGNEEFDIEQITGFSACSSVENYEFLNNIGSGTFGVVSRGKCKTTGEIVALKRIKLMKDFTSKEGFPLTALREMNTLLQMRHENLVCAREVVCGSDLNKIFIVMDYMDHTLKDVMERYRFSVSEGKRLMIQLLSGLQYIHEDCWLIHRDLKSSNILLDNQGCLKICDYGLTRKYGSPIRDNYTPVVVTLWYRDMWSVGCIFYEIITGEVLFTGKDEIDQVKKIFEILGKPTEQEYPGFTQLPAIKKFKWQIDNIKGRASLIKRLKTQFQLSDSGCDLLNRLLCFDPDKRITAKEALSHPFFKEAPLPQTKENMPSFPSLQTIDSSKRKHASSSESFDHPPQVFRSDAIAMENEFKRFMEQ
nr:unnamed protein product [Naegleria fowleri]